MLTIKFLDTFNIELQHGIIYQCQKDNIDELEDSVASDLIAKGLAESAKIEAKEDKKVKKSDKPDLKIEV